MGARYGGLDQFSAASGSMKGVPRNSATGALVT